MFRAATHSAVWWQSEGILEDLARAIRVYAVVHFSIVGISHIVLPTAWVELFKLMRTQNRAGVFAHGFLSLFFGATIVSLHNVWSGPHTLLTIVGWLYVTKAASCFLTPDFQLASLRRVSEQRVWELRAAGAAYLSVAIFLSLARDALASKI